MITPHGEAGRGADFGAALEVVDFLCAAGIRGIVLLGSTGEFLTLNAGERVRLTYLAVKRSRVPVLAGVGHATLEGALELGRQACSAGAAGLLLMPPYFFRYGQEDIREFYLRFAERIGAGAPVYLYNIPAFTSEIACDTALDLLSTGSFAGIKDSGGDYGYFLRLREAAARDGFTVLVGDDALFARARAAGADGVVSGTASALPELLLAIDRAIAAGDTAAAARLDALLSEFIAWSGCFPAPVAVRAAAEARNLKTGPQALPLAPQNQELLARFREWFQGWLPEVLAEASHV